MTQSAIYARGKKTHRDENFPVASYIISKKYRSAILAFYRFARAADDVADHPGLAAQEKITQLDQFEATLLGKNDGVADALSLREELAHRQLSPRHALDLLIAFRQDALKSRYRDWGELLHYCMYSAAPVGRFVLDVHGEDAFTWPASDALCSALQIINHLQDCKADYQRLNRVYIPQKTFALYGSDETALVLPQASPGLRGCLNDLVAQTQAILAPRALSPQVKNRRLRLEVRIIETLAHRLLHLLRTRDPLSQKVHLSRLQFISVLLSAMFAPTTQREET